MSAEVETDGTHPALPVCRQCGAGEIEPNYGMPLCVPCRNWFAKRPFPKWISVSAILILALLAAAIVDLPSSLSSGIAFERGQRAEKSGKYAAAIQEYQKVFESFPDSTVVAARLVIACCRGDRPAEAAAAMHTLAGRKMPKALANEVNRAITNMQRRQGH